MSLLIRGTSQQVGDSRWQMPLPFQSPAVFLRDLFLVGVGILDQFNSLYCHSPYRRVPHGPLGRDAALRWFCKKSWLSCFSPARLWLCIHVRQQKQGAYHGHGSHETLGQKVGHNKVVCKLLCSGVACCAVIVTCHERGLDGVGKGQARGIHWGHSGGLWDAKTRNLEFIL